MKNPYKKPRKLRRGLADPGMSTRAIARELGISNAGVQLIERGALEKLRKALRGWTP